MASWGALGANFGCVVGNGRKWLPGVLLVPISCVWSEMVENGFLGGSWGSWGPLLAIIAMAFVSMIAVMRVMMSMSFLFMLLLMMIDDGFYDG